MSQEQQTCSWCHVVLKIHGNTRKNWQRFCSDVCRINAWRFHQRFPRTTVWGKDPFRHDQ